MNIEEKKHIINDKLGNSEMLFYGLHFWKWGTNNQLHLWVGEEEHIHPVREKVKNECKDLLHGIMLNVGTMDNENGPVI